MVYIYAVRQIVDRAASLATCPIYSMYSSCKCILVAVSTHRQTVHAVCLFIWFICVLCSSGRYPFDIEGFRSLSGYEAIRTQRLCSLLLVFFSMFFFVTRATVYNQQKEKKDRACVCYHPSLQIKQSLTNLNTIELTY